MAPDSTRALAMTVWYDYQCQYSNRAIRWLDGLGPGVARVTYRAFGEEQVQRDASATAWRLWEQPLDYEHHEGKPRKRSLAAFLATAIVAATGDPATVARFRHALLDARWTDKRDLADPAVLVELAGATGADARTVAETLAGTGASGAARQAAARERIAADWAAAHTDHAIFGVPTIRWGDVAPVYLRLAHLPDPDEAQPLFDALVDLRERFPLVLELKQPDRLDVG
jgi:DSBA-like thioredoxin domain